MTEATDSVKRYVAEKDFDITCFDPTQYDLYWRFVAERQAVWFRRVCMQREWPWTQDPILQAEFITNNYRELDPGTQYVVSSIVENADYSDLDKMFNVVMYRLMGSQPPTHRLVASTVDDYDVDVFIKVLREQDSDVFKVFGDAYRVAGYNDEGGEDKIENVGRLFVKIADMMPEYHRRVEASPDVQTIFKVFKDIPGLGEFLAHQIVVDLLTGPDPVLPYGQNQWAQAGPGARSGMWAMLAPDVKPRNLLMVMRWLHAHQREEFAARDLPFVRPLDHDGEPLDLSLCNIQSTLCEFFKYTRIWQGHKTVGVRKYDFERRSVLEPALYCESDVVGEVEFINGPRLTPEPPSPEETSEALSDLETDEEAEAAVEPSPEAGEQGEAAQATLEPFSVTLPASVEGGPTVSLSITININGGTRP